jgi:hypothetical protein
VDFSCLSYIRGRGVAKFIIHEMAVEDKLTAFSVCEKWVREVENGLFLS